MNRQTFELLILGSSSASPAYGRNLSAQLLNICERYFLIDCGEATQMQLRRFKARFQKIDHIFISHLHGDHFFGLPGFLSSMNLLGRRQKLRIYAPAQLKQVISILVKASDTHLGFEVEWIDTDNKALNLLFEDAKVEVYSFPLKHRVICTGFLFREKPLPRKINKTLLEELHVSFADIMKLKKGQDVVNAMGEHISNRAATVDPPPPRSFAYCSDTLPEPRTIEFIRGVDLLYHESTFLEDNLERAANTYHSTAAQAARVAAEAGVKTLLLGHFSARYPDLEPFLDEARPLFSNSELATDGKKFKI